MAVYNCVCENCNKVTSVDTEVTKIHPDYDTYVSAYGKLITTCKHCGKNAFADWHGMDGRRPNIGYF